MTRLIDESERELIPKFLRLGFHDCVGGCDGCVDLTNRDNTGLKEPIEAIYPIVDKFKESYSRADIWALATLVAADVSHSFLVALIVWFLTPSQLTASLFLSLNIFITDGID